MFDRFLVPAITGVAVLAVTGFVAVALLFIFRASAELLVHG